MNISTLAHTRDVPLVSFGPKWPIYGGSSLDKKSYLAPFSRYAHIYVISMHIWIFNLGIDLESFQGRIPTQNSRFMGGRPPDKKSYLAPFSRYAHIYVLIHDLFPGIHILNIEPWDRLTNFSRTYSEAE